MRAAAMDDYFFNKIKSHPRRCISREELSSGQEVSSHL